MKVLHIRRTFFMVLLLTLILIMAKLRTNLTMGSLQHEPLPFFVFLLPIFFVLHGFAQYYHFVPVQSFFLLLIRYVIVAFLLFGFFKLLYRDRVKAAMAAFISLLCFFFFGALHDFLRSFLHNTFFVKYSFLTPVVLLTCLSLLYILKRKPVAPKLILYLNVLFGILIVIDTVSIGLKALSNEKGGVSKDCSLCEKPDVHFIVVDGYAGNDQMINEFSSNNSFFLDSLEQLGFKVMSNSRANYVRTEFSMASMLNMEYHQLKDYTVTDESLKYCFKQIAKNKVVDLFERQGYEFVNNSIFDIGNKISPVKNSFLLRGTDLIESETLLARLRRDVYLPLLMRYFKNSELYKSFLFQPYYSDSIVTSRLANLANTNASKPRFVYTHLLMTHFPYYFKEDGQLNQPDDISVDNYDNKDLYLANYKFTNKRLLSLVTQLLKLRGKPPVILLVSDHGFRYGAHPNYTLSNLAAVYLPNKNNKFYHDSLSNVNQFRALFNELFRQGLPMIEDMNGEVLQGKANTTRYLEENKKGN